MCQLKQLNADQALLVANIVAGKVDRKETFSKYSIFVDYRILSGESIRYSQSPDIASDVAAIIREVVSDLGGYENEYVNKTGAVYCEWSPIKVNDDEDQEGKDYLAGSDALDAACDGCDCNVNGKCTKEDEDEEIKVYEEYETTLTRGSNNQIRIPSRIVRAAGMESGDKVYVVNIPGTNHGYITNDIAGVEDIVKEATVNVDGRIHLTVWMDKFTVEAGYCEILIAESVR